jgi:tetratricopeptide (TPR) repeat protein
MGSLAFAADDNALDLPHLARSARGAVLLINCFDGAGKIIKTGSGFFVSEDGRIVTNWHVVDGISSAEAKTENGAFYKIDGILISSATLDLAVLKAETKKVEFLAIHDGDPPEVGARIAVIGSPLSLEGTLTEGIVSANRTDQTGSWLQITAPISPGSSGSPVLDKGGQVVGVATLNSNGRSQNVNFARSSRDLNTLINAIQNDTKLQTFEELASARQDQLLSDPDEIAAKAAVWRKDFPSALKSLNKVKERFPNNDPRLLLQLGIVYQFLSLHDDALKAFQEAVKIDPANAVGWVSLATEFRHFRMFDDAINASNQALRIQPDDARAWRELGETYIDQNLFVGLAVEPLRKATQLDAEDWHAWCDLAMAFHAVGNFTEADKAMKRCAEVSKLSRVPDIKGAKPISKSADGSIVKFDNGVLLFKDGHVEWDAGGFRWRQWDGYEAEKVGPSSSASPPISAPQKEPIDTFYAQDPTNFSLPLWKNFKLGPVPNSSSSRAANSSSVGQPINCRIISLKNGDLLNVRKGPGATYPIVARFSFHQNELIKLREGAEERVKNGTTTWRKVYSANSADFIGWAGEQYLADDNP